jgi:hypothetical protein
VPSHVTNQPAADRVDAQTHDPINIATEDVDNVFPVGLRTMDRGVKEYFQDMDVPTKDGTRKLDVRIAGGDKTILFWKQLMDADSENRIRLPVMSVNRTGWNWNPQRMTPASAGHFFYRRLADKDGTRAIVSPRELGVFVNYTLSVWTERKRDMEYISYQIMSRFNPIAEWRVSDEFMNGYIIGKFEGASDNSDIDVDPNQLAKVRYDFTIQIEGWIPLPGRVVPTVLGKVQVLKEQDTGEFFEVIKPSSRRIL